MSSPNPFFASSQHQQRPTATNNRSLIVYRQLCKKFWLLRDAIRRTGASVASNAGGFGEGSIANIQAMVTSMLGCATQLRQLTALGHSSSSASSAADSLDRPTTVSSAFGSFSTAVAPRDLIWLSPAAVPDLLKIPEKDEGVVEDQGLKETAASKISSRLITSEKVKRLSALNHELDLISQAIQTDFDQLLSNESSSSPSPSKRLSTGSSGQGDQTMTTSF
jgi:hypothetical protein